MPTTGATYIDTIFASSGTATQVPDAVQGDGSISFTQGYGPNYELAQGVPGSLNVELAEFNYLMNLITKILQTYQQQTVAPWITHAENGGSAFPYAKNALVFYTDGKIYQSLVNSNTTDPVNDSVHWKTFSSYSQIPIAGVQVLNSTTDKSAWTELDISSAVPANATSCSGYLSTQGAHPTTAIEIASDSSGSGIYYFGNSSTSTSAGAPFSNLLLPTPQKLYYISNTSSGTGTYVIFISGYTV